MTWSKLGDKFPEKLKRARELDAAGVELKDHNRQKPRKSGDKNHETECTVPSTPREGHMSEQERVAERGNGRRVRSTEERALEALERLYESGVKIEVSGPEDYSMAATALKGAAVGGTLGGLAAGLGVGLGIKGASPALVIGASTAGAAGGSVIGAAVAVTIWDGKKPKKSKKSKKRDDDDDDD